MTENEWFTSLPVQKLESLVKELDLTMNISCHYVTGTHKKKQVMLQL
jgi:hypothetical protein